MSSIRENITSLKNLIPGHVRVVAVSKTQSTEIIKSAYDAGLRIFGENKMQEIIAKQPQLPSDIKWHFVGHLQTNKVKFLAPFIHTIESVDSLKLLREINKHALKSDRKVLCLLQFHIASEESKFGLDLAEAEEILQSSEFQNITHAIVAGVMGMATFTDNETLIRNEFKKLKEIFDYLKNKYFADNPDFVEISMGMSGDYQIAIEEGSTIVRIGTALFGSRNYH